MAEFRIPVSTYRIQFSLAFRFVDGLDLVPYLNDLGVTDLYSSPRFKARRGSSHAYDVADPLRINSELGTEDEFAELAGKLRAYNMGLLLDIVPNHMVASSENPWWVDLLENGRDSLFVSHFAVDWGRAMAKARRRPRIVLPILGDLYGSVLNKGEIGLKLDENGFYARYAETRLPLDPKSYSLILAPCTETARSRGADDAAREVERLMAAFDSLPSGVETDEERETRHGEKDRLKAELWSAYNSIPEFKTQLDECLMAMSGIPGEPATFDSLDRILDEQHYRVAYWRMAAEDLNYRRFFDITDLVGIRVEDPKVFDSRHAEGLRIINLGLVTGIRIDHIDGLWDPAEYLARLRSRVLGGDAARPGCAGFYVIAEKILGANEDLPYDWEVCGTTGYEYLNWLNGVFIDPRGLGELDAFYRRFTGFEMSMTEVQYDRQKFVLDLLFAGEVRALGYHLGRLAALDRLARDLPFNDLLQAFVEVTARLPIYRTYINSLEVSERDRRYLEDCIVAAEKAMPAIDPEVFAFLRRVLLLDVPHYIEHPDEWVGFIQGWQQITGPCMAKGFEDTTCYVYNRLLSQNEVGGGPELSDPPVDVDAFHCRNRRRLARWPHSLNATSTHDTKRSEDVRARINVLSEIPGEWAECVERWAANNERHKSGGAPDRNDEYMLYQTLVGVWPLSEEDRPALGDRLRNFAQKAVREAKVHSTWLNPNETYEAALLKFIDGILDDKEFLEDFARFHERIAHRGAVNALAQVVLKVCSPGVPDFYQGTELWDFSLVDPDNRRPVDFKKRAALLDELRRAEVHDLQGLVADLTSNWPDGRIKLYVTYKSLAFRRAHAELFQAGEYLPVNGARHACAFARRRGEDWAVVAVRRFGSEDETLTLPAGAPSQWRNIFTGEEVSSMRVADLLAAFPVAVLEPVRG